jgi:hypothetical protein
MKQTGHVTSARNMNPYRIFVGKPGGKRPLGRPRCRWKDNIQMELTEIELGGMDLIQLI